jgi:hypothetical protein
LSDNNTAEEEYNQYVLSNGIHAKVDAIINAEILDMLYTRARQKIRQRGGMLTTQDALKLVLEQDREAIRNEAIDDIAKMDPILAENLRSEDEQTRKSAERLFDMMLEEMESP